MSFQKRNTALFKSATIEATLSFLETSEDGLSLLDVNERKSFFGRNEIPEKSENLFVEFLRRYWGPMPWLLELAMLLSFVLKHDVEAGVIFFLLTVNALIGFIHSYRSKKVVELLKQKLAIQAKVFRDGTFITIESRELVPGDILMLRLGDAIPADAKVLKGVLFVDESSLTGESLSVEKGFSDILYAGSMVKRGEARCVVVNTGENTFFGKTVQLVKGAKPSSHQEEILLSVITYSMSFVFLASFINESRFH